MGIDTILNLLHWGFTLVVVYVCYNLYVQNVKLEAELIRTVKVTDRADNFYNFVLNIMISTLDKLREVDRRGAFSSDDEVGFTFRTIVEIIEHTKHQLQLQGNKEEEPPIEKTTLK